MLSERMPPNLLWLAIIGLCVLGFVGVMGYWAGWNHGSVSGLEACRVWLAEQSSFQYGVRFDPGLINDSVGNLTSYIK